MTCTNICQACNLNQHYHVLYCLLHVMHHFVVFNNLRHFFVHARGAHTCERALFCSCDLHVNPMVLKVEDDLDILRMYLHIKNEVAGFKAFKT